MRTLLRERDPGSEPSRRDVDTAQLDEAEEEEWRDKSRSPEARKESQHRRQQQRLKYNSA